LRTPHAPRLSRRHECSHGRAARLLLELQKVNSSSGISGIASAGMSKAGPVRLVRDRRDAGRSAGALLRLAAHGAQESRRVVCTGTPFSLVPAMRGSVSLISLAEGVILSGGTRFIPDAAGTIGSTYLARPQETEAA
jgi:hypothetical protein